VKGRDWFDFEWYVRKGIVLNLKNFIVRGRGSGNLQDKQLTELQFRKLLTNRIHSGDIEKVKADAVPFIPDRTKFDIWSRTYFADLAGHLKVT
jgi:hypothetical protein